MWPAVFLDRDGTIIEDCGDLSNPAQVKFLPGVFAALQKLQKKYRLFIITNQSGIAKKSISRQQADSVNNHVTEELKKNNVIIQDIYLCPHCRQDHCRCAKPSPFFLYQAAVKHKIDLSGSFIIGDHPHDAETAMHVFGMAGLCVLTGHGYKHQADFACGVPVFKDIVRAAEYILAQNRSTDLRELFSKAAETIKNGGLVAFPTETVYGLGACVFNAKACARIFEVKKRPYFDPLIVHIKDFNQLDEVVIKPSGLFIRLAENLWPGPLTIICRKNKNIPDIVTAGLDTVAVRMPAHPYALKLLEYTDCPLAAPSANPFGYISPTIAEHVRRQLADKVGIIIDGGPCRHGIESTIISVENDECVLLRPGAISCEEIEKIIGKPVKKINSGKNNAPGNLKSHYSPHTALKIVNAEDLPALARKPEKKGLLSWQGINVPDGFLNTEILSPSGNLTEAAACLFSALHRLDQANLDIIYALSVPEYGLGLAIADRLRKAAGI